MFEVVVSLHLVVTMAWFVAMMGFVMVGLVGFLATIIREPGQVRKGVAISLPCYHCGFCPLTSCAESRVILTALCGLRTSKGKVLRF